MYIDTSWTYPDNFTLAVFATWQKKRHLVILEGIYFKILYRAYYALF